MSDRWFCSVPTQTNPNRAYSICGTSLGRESNLNIYADEQFDAPTIFNRLFEAGKSIGLYWTDPWKEGKSYTHYTFPQLGRTIFLNGTIRQFTEQARTGTLPSFSYIEPQWGYGKGTLFKQGTDLHPPTHVRPGDQFVGKIYAAVRASPQWEKTLMIVTFDEHGGTYDHVAPPWGAINPDGKDGPSGFRFDLFGVRVPTLLISPYIRQGTVFRAPEGSAAPFDHTSFVKTLLLWAGVDPATAGLGARVPAAPSFDGVLVPHIVNDTVVDVLGPAAPAEIASVPGVALDPPAGAGQPLDELFAGVGAVATRAIFEHNLDLAGILADLTRYRADPAAFEAALTIDPPVSAPHPD